MQLVRWRGGGCHDEDHGHDEYKSVLIHLFLLQLKALYANYERRALSSQPTPYQVLLYKSVGGANTPVQWVAIMNSLKSIRPFWSLR